MKKSTTAGLLASMLSPGWPYGRILDSEDRAPNKPNGMSQQKRRKRARWVK